MSLTKEFLLSPGTLLHPSLPSSLLRIKFIESELSDIQDLLSLTTYKKPDFIGSHPVTLTLDNLALILKDRQDFVICEKSDGVRFMLIILSNGLSYFTGRQMGNQRTQSKQYFQCDIQLPKFFQITQYDDDNFDQNTYINYLFDGELIIDTYE